MQKTDINRLKTLAIGLLLIGYVVGQTAVQTAQAQTAIPDLPRCATNLTTGWVDDALTKITADGLTNFYPESGDNRVMIIRPTGTTTTSLYITRAWANTRIIYGTGTPQLSFSGADAANPVYRFTIDTTAGTLGTVVRMTGTITIQAECATLNKETLSSTGTRNHDVSRSFPTFANARYFPSISKNVASVAATPNCPTGQTGTYPDACVPPCPTGQTGTYPSCTIAGGSNSTTTAGLTSDEARELLHEYSLKGATLLGSLAASYLIIKQFRWKSNV
jgi:hypothetical protein